MKALDVFASVAQPNGQPLAATVLQLECFSLQAADWVVVGQAATDGQGQYRARVEMPLSDESTAPQVRLSLGGASGSRVLSEGGRISYAPRTGLLSIDFGKLTALPEPVTLQPATADKRFKSIAATQVMGMAATARPLIQPLAATPVTAAPITAAPVLRPDLKPADTPIRTVEVDSPVLLSLRSQLDTTKLDLANLSTAHQATQVELNKTLAERATLQVQVQNLEKDRLRLSGELEAVKARPVLGNVVGLQTLTQDLQGQFSRAQTSIASTDSGMRLGDVRIKLRGKIGPDGQFQLPTAEELLKPDASHVLDEVDLGLHAPEAAAVDLTVPVPQLARLTESAARQVLQSLGLRLETATGAAQDGFATGQAVRQAPLAGARAARGSAVLVVFAQ